MNAAVRPMLVDHTGRPLRSAQSHQAADLVGNELRSWTPELLSADGELLPELDTLRARTADMIRNHGLTSGAVQTHLDNIIGGGLRLSAKPDWRALGLSAEWAREWQRDVESKYALWATDPDKHCDASLRKTVPQMLAQAYRSYLTAFEILATAEWVERPGARYRTAIQMIDPARLSNPDGRQDSDTLRAGVELGPYGEPLAYWIASGLQGDPFQWMTARRWRRVPRATAWGRPLVIHIYDEERAGQSRGKNGIVSVLARMKMLEKYEQVHLQAAILNAMYAAVIESSMDWSSVGTALGAGSQNDSVYGYMTNRAAWHQEGNVRYNGVKIPHLYPGEKLSLLAPQHPNAAFASFEEAALRYLAGGFNLSYEQFSRDYSKSNYSSARAAMLETWRFFTSRRKFIAYPFATAIYSLWLEEAIDRGDVTIPTGAPTFYAAKAAWTRCKWIGPGRGHIDPLKEANATRIEYYLGLTTLEKEAAERGEDWEEILEQRAEEQAMAKRLGVAIGVGAGAPAEPDPDDDEDDRRNGPANTVAEP